MRLHHRLAERIAPPAGKAPAWGDPWLWAAVAAAALLRLPRLGLPSLWLDEAISARMAALPPAALAGALGPDLHPPGYYLLLRLWATPWPALPSGMTGEWGLRSLSAVASLLTVPLAWWIGGALAGDAGVRARAARWAAWLVALSPFAVSLGREARSHALLGLLLAAQVALWLRLRRHSGSAAAWAAMASLLAAGFYLHYHALLFALALTVAAWRPEPAGSSFLRRWWIALAAAAALFAPWVPLLADQAGGGIRGWLPFHHSPLILARTVARFLRGDAGSDELALLSVPALFLAVRGARRGGWRVASVAAIPLGVAYLLSLRANVWEARSFAAEAVLAAVLVGRGIAVPWGPRRERLAVGFAASVVLAAMAVGTVQGWRRDARPPEDWRGLVAAMERSTSGTTAVIYPFDGPLAPLLYYATPGRLLAVPGLEPAEEGRLVPVADLTAPLAPAERICILSYLEAVYDSEGSLRRRLDAAPSLIRVGEIEAGTLRAECYRLPPVPSTD